MAIFVKKAPALVEDIDFGFGVNENIRLGSQVNSIHLPYSLTESTKDALDNRPTVADADLMYAKLAGSSAQVFEVATAIAPTDATPLAQVEDAIEVLNLAKAERSEVIRKGASESYTPSADTDPVNKGYADALIGDKFLGAVTGAFIAKSVVDGTTDVTVTVTNGVITGIV